MNEKNSTAITLSPLKLEHADALFSIIRTHRDHLRTWLPWPDQVTDIHHTRAYIESVLNPQNKHFGPAFVISFGEQICGLVSFHYIDWSKKCGEIGYWLARDYCGKGIMTRATAELIELGFNRLKLQRIEIRCASGNKKSRAVAERLGLYHERCIHRAEKIRDEYLDHEVYSILAEEHQS